jgi:allophanate hydrolase subunit 2
VLGSKSTYTLGGLGGVRGRLLKKGDLLEVGVPRAPLDSLPGRRAKKEILPRFGAEKVLRVVLGPQDDHVKEASVADFLNSDYRVSIRANRVGYRFEGPQLFFKERAESRDAGSDPSNIVDDGNAIGAIQIPAGKEPICLGVDGVTMGGYVKIACLIAADMDRMAQLPLREAVRFQSVTVQEARSILQEALGKIREENVIRE